MSPNRRTAGRRPAPAASLLADAKKPARIIDAASDVPSPTPDTIVGAPPVAQVSIEEHKAKQREYREWLAKMSSETPAQAVAEEQDEVVEPLKLPTPEERAERAHEEALGYYLACLAEMPADEPRFLVGTRPPRPRFGGLLLEIGDVIPGAARWPRLDTWLRAGIVVPEDAVRRVS